MSINNKYIEVIQNYQKNADYSTEQAKELVQAFGNEVPFPSEEELNALITEVREECHRKLSEHISDEFLAYQAIILHLTRGIGIGTYTV
tara:strand:+ start:3908 stop:4174 length:267 start_codon:yes stop_codon:yes gene_type:complete